MSTYLNARTMLAPYVDNGVAATNTTRIDQRIDEAQRRLIEHFNFFSRQEDADRAALTWQAGGTTGNPATGSLILPDLDATKSMILALWREENNDLERSATLEQKAYSYIERKITADVDRERKTAFQTLALTGQNTFGGMVGRVGLETVVKYRMPEARIRSYINQAYQQAIDHHNFIARSEEFDRDPLTFVALSTNSDSFPAALPGEVIRLLTLSLLMADNGADGAAIKTQAFELIQRNVITLVEAARKGFTGEVGRLHNELPGGTRIKSSRLQTYLDQAATDAGAQWAFFSRREDYKRTAPTVFSFEIRKKLVEAYTATAGGQADVATALKQEATLLIERDLMAAVEAERRDELGEVGQLHDELPDGVKVPTARMTEYLNQAVLDATAHWNFLIRREDYSTGTLPNPFPFEIRKKLVESYLATARGTATAGNDKVVDLSASLKSEAFSLIERNLMAQVEKARREYTADADVAKLHNELPEGLKYPTTRLAAYLSQAVTEATDHFNFLARREDYNATAPTFPFEIRKKLVEACIAVAQGAPDIASQLKQTAFELIERNLMTQVEATRRNVAGSPEETRLHNELPDGVKVPTARLTTYLSTAATEALAHYNFLAKREDYNATAPGTFTFEIRKKLVESYLATAQAAPDVATKLKQEAFELIERDLMTQVEATRRNVAGSPEETRLHNELPDGVKVPTARLTTYLTTAATEALAHYNFLAKREDYNATAPATFTFEIRKKLVESYLATAQAAPDVATKLKQEAFELIERDLMTQVEASRRAVATFAGRLHNELPDGVKIPTARIDAYLTTANTEATAHWNFLARREDYKATAPLTFDDEIRKKLVESYVATSRGQADAAAAFKQEAFALVERNLVRGVEEARRDTTGEIGRLHNEIAGGLQIPTVRMQTLADQAVTEIRSHQAFLQRREDYSGSRPAVTYEQKKLMIESYLVPAAMTRKNNSPTGSVVVVNGRDEDSKYADAAGAIKASALALVERDIVAMIEDDRRAKRQQLAASSPDTFGYHWGRAGLELPEAYRISDAAIKRLINTAEEQLMLTGKWVGTVESYTLSVTATGEFFLPQEIETILFMSFDNNPRAVHDRYSEWLRGGPGYRGADYTWMQGAVDRGEVLDPADGKLKRKYFITLPDTVPVVRILGKRRFLPHASDTEKMYLRNFAAVFEAAKGFLLGGDQIAAHMEKATQMLATQIAQQNFTGQPPIRRAVRFMR